MMWKPLASAALCVTMVTAIHSTALAAGPGIATNWAESTWTQEQCFARAEATFTELGLAPIESSKFSRSAQTGDYTLMIQCMGAAKNLILFITAGPVRAEVQKHQAQLFDKF
jgi:hypothetical protein